MMRTTPRLFSIVGQAALLLTVTYFVLVLILYKMSLLSNPSSFGKAVVLLVVLVLPIGLASSRMFHQLKTHYSRRESLGGSIAFAVFTPVPLAIGLVLGELVGGYVEVFVGSQSRLVPFLGAVTGIVIIVALMTLGPSAFIMWLVRRGKSQEDMNGRVG